MKVHKMFCIDVDLVDKLRDTNGSALVNELLKTHFGTSRETIERRKLDIEKVVNELDIEERQLSLVENENAKQKVLRDRVEAEHAKKKELFEKEKAILTRKAKNKEITFEEYRELVEELRSKWGLR